MVFRRGGSICTGTHILRLPMRLDRELQRALIEPRGDVERAREYVEAIRGHKLSEGAQHLQVALGAVLTRPLREVEAVDGDLLVHEE